MPNLGVWEIVLLALVVLLVFGPRRLPQLGRMLGRGMREFRDAVGGPGREIKEAVGGVPREVKESLIGAPGAPEEPKEENEP